MDHRMSFDYVRALIMTRVRDERAASLVEYALLVALIAVVCIAAIQLLGNSASSKFSSVGRTISSAS